MSAPQAPRKEEGFSAVTDYHPDQSANETAKKQEEDINVLQQNPKQKRGACGGRRFSWFSSGKKKNDKRALQPSVPFSQSRPKVYNACKTAGKIALIALAIMVGIVIVLGAMGLMLHYGAQVSWNDIQKFFTHQIDNLTIGKALLYFGLTGAGVVGLSAVAVYAIKSALDKCKARKIQHQEQNPAPESHQREDTVSFPGSPQYQRKAVSLPNSPRYQRKEKQGNTRHQEESTAPKPSNPKSDVLSQLSPTSPIPEHNLNQSLTQEFADDAL